MIERGGINATLKGGKSATVADSLRPRSDLQRELEDAEQQIQDTKAAYYAALTARHRALWALAHRPQVFCGGRARKPPPSKSTPGALANTVLKFSDSAI